mgnify:CR=1 FL=1
MLSPERALIFRITHVANVPWLLRHGLHCRASPVRDPAFRSIGNPELIEKRRTRVVPAPPGGSLGEDYVPFYFTPHSPMLLNLKTGYGGVPQTRMADVAILAASLRDLAARDIPFLFTDRHAYLTAAQFYRGLDDLATAVDWSLLRSRDFKRRPDDPGRFERYQAEALVHRYSEAQMVPLETAVRQAGLTTPVVARPAYYF